MSPSGRPPRDTGSESADRGGLTRREFFGTAVAVGAVIVWATEFPFSDAVTGQTIGPGGGPTGPTGAGAAAAITAEPRVTG
jgi:hypothetical protein